MSTSLQTLREKIKEGNVIPVIGAGVSQAAANLPGWKGLVENGLSYAENRKLSLHLLEEIKAALRDDELTKAAVLLKEVLNAPLSPFSLWLEDVFGKITYSSKELLKSIEELAFPIVLTTNYDTLLSSFSPIMPKKVLDWTQHEEVLRTLKKKEEFILHLHGIYEKPDTLIFGADDYKKLESEFGYKDILGQLWNSYHFLFIGCSKDGVMDDDFITTIEFMNKWFPGYPHQHFILLNEKDFSTGAHETLLKKCRIEAVSYGADRTFLPGFIKNLDTDKIKFKKKSLNLKSYIDERLKLVTEDPEEIPKLLTSVLPANGQWVESEQIGILDKALIEFNNNIANKKQKFGLYQEIIKGLIKVSELDEKVNLWSFGASIAPSQQDNFIEVAIIAFNALNRIPVDLMDEIRARKFSLIHEYYFSGYLGRFILEFKGMKEAGINVVKFYRNDQYFFENLKRIIESLKKFLDIKPEQVFEEIEPPSACENLPAEFVAYSVGAKLFVADKLNLVNPSANLSLEKNLPLAGIDLIEINKMIFLLGYNSKYCFLWNPKSPLAPKQIYSSDIGETIEFVYVNKNSNKNEINIITNKRCFLYFNCEFQEVTSRSTFSKFLKIQSSNIYIAKQPGDTLYQGSCLFKSTNALDWTPFYTKIELWKDLLQIPDVKEVYEEAKRNYKSETGNFIGFYSMGIHSISYGSEQILICSFGYAQLIGNRGGSCLFFIDLRNFKIFKKIYLPDCYSVLLCQVGFKSLIATSHWRNSKQRDIGFKIDISEENTQIIDFKTPSSNIVSFDDDVESIHIFDGASVLIKLLNKKIAILNHRNMLVEVTYAFDDYLGPLSVH